MSVGVARSSGVVTLPFARTEEVVGAGLLVKYEASEEPAWLVALLASVMFFLGMEKLRGRADDLRRRD
jgi:hypothetical protein